MMPYTLNPKPYTLSPEKPKLAVQGWGFSVLPGLGFRVRGLGLRVPGLGIRVSGPSKLRVLVIWCFWCSCSGFSVLGCERFVS